MPALPQPARRFRAAFAALALAFALATPAVAEPGGAADYLARANAAFAADRMVAPAGDNALEWTLAARAIDPDSERVREGLNDLYPLVVAAIDREIARGNRAEALRIIDLLETAMPNSLAARQARTRLGVGARATSQVVALAPAS